MLAQPFFILNFSSARNYMNTDNGWYKKILGRQSLLPP